jgi:ferredoxin
MAIMITDECINCGACESECPNTAIFEGGVEWTWGGKTKIQEVAYPDGTIVSRNDKLPPKSDEFYYIISEKCTECVNYHEEPSCASVCPVDCCVPDPDYSETHEILEAKQKWLHTEA